MALDAPFFWHFLDQVSLYMMAPLFIYYLQHLFGNGIFRIQVPIKWAYFLFALVAGSGAALDLLSLQQTNRVFNSVILISFGITIGNVLYLAVKNRKNARLIAIGSLVFLLFAVHDWLIGTQFLPWHRLMMQWGFVIFLCFLAAAAFSHVRTMLSLKRTEILGDIRAHAIARTTQNLAHDVRKPFSMLKMVLAAVSEARDPAVTQEIAAVALPEVNQAIATVEGMIQDVMQIGSTAEPNREVASPEAIIDAAVNELCRIFPDSQLEFEYDLRHRHSLFVDTMRVGRVFSNILVNAAQAMKGKGQLWLKTKEEPGFIEFKIGNPGSTIPNENLSRLFDAFFTSGKRGGTGLGLAIAQKVVGEHDGTIRCESGITPSRPMGYVEFIFTLPTSSELNPKRKEALPTHSKEIHDQLTKLKKRDSDGASTDELEQEQILSQKIYAWSEKIPSILIVDDEAVYRNSVAGLLLNFRGGESDVSKIPIFFAKNATEALDMMQKHNPFLIIQDIDLGNDSKSGVEVIKDLRDAGYRGRICVHSNRFLFDDQKIATDAGADSVFPKPMSRTHLFKLMISSLPANIPKKSISIASPDQRRENTKSPLWTTV